MAVSAATISKALEKLPSQVAGPGGAVAVTVKGAVVAHKVWGYANLEERVPLTADTLMPLCSITQQMLCFLLDSLNRDSQDPFSFWKQLQSELGHLLPQSLASHPGLTLQTLCNNSSGIRDYWAMTVLWGAQADGRFSLSEDLPLVLQRLKTPQFQPGTEYSYSNTNFNILARLIERVTRRPIGELIAERVFCPAEMHTAAFCEDTAKSPRPCVGHELGDGGLSFAAVRNKVEWSGDAGVVASLSDMVAYERFIDASWQDPRSWYSRMAKRPKHADGSDARYQCGLAYAEVGGVRTIGHRGALRGFRMHRLHVPSIGLSIVVMFNHEADATEVAEELLMDILGLRREGETVAPSADWAGSFLDAETELVVTAEPGGGDGTVSVNYTGYPETVTATDAHHAQSRDMHASVDARSLHIQRYDDNRELRCSRILPATSRSSWAQIKGEYYCAEIDSTFFCTGHEGVMYAVFEGFLGIGPALPMRELGRDVWVARQARGLDTLASGDWTIVFKVKGDGGVVGATIGCWLARKLQFSKLSAIAAC